MPETPETVIKHFGESTAYSAKGHFKSADFRKNFSTFLIIINILFSVLALMDFFTAKMLQCIGAIPLVASMVLMYYQTKGESDYVSTSMSTGEDYLKLHNEILTTLSKGTYTNADVETIRDKVNRINGKKKPSISWMGRRIAKRAIEKKGEMNIWWK